MQQIRFPRPVALALALAALAGTPAAFAQTEIVAQPNPQADRLAQQMRVLAANPRNVDALLEAGLLSARLGDNAAAFAFFARAEALDASNPRILAGRATALVRMERPGEALRLFQSAESRGLSMRPYAADRGFAYDLLGQPTLAQADYRVALSESRDDELVRRYALSLGITGRTDEAMRELDPLLRRSDRAGWRARAFIMAMNGDAPGAERIAGNMMPGSAGPSLGGFFQRLAAMSPADRAFAVHFGSVAPTQARLADARLAPALPAYVAERRPVQLAQAQPGAQARATAAARTPDRRSRREREREERAAREAARRQPVRTAALRPAAPSRSARFGGSRTPIVQYRPMTREDQVAAAAPQPSASTSVQIAAARTPPAERNTVVAGTSTTTPRPAAASPTAARSAVDPALRPSLPAAGERLAAAVVPGAQRPDAPAPAPERSAVVPASSTILPAAREQLAAVAPSASGAVTPTAAPAPSQPFVTPPATPDVSVSPPPHAPAPLARSVEPLPDPSPPPRAEPAPPGPARVGEEDSVLASIVASITIPAEELEALNRPSIDLARAPAPEPEPVRASPPPVVRKPEAKPAVRKPEPEKAEAKPIKKPEPKKPEPKKPEPKKPPVKAEPSRIWVQVAGGANVADLPKAWRAVVAKAPAALKGRAAWTTPLRATNRLLAGPFKTNAEAQGFVNSLRKEGVAAFAVTSEAGQKVTRLPAN